MKVKRKTTKLIQSDYVTVAFAKAWVDGPSTNTVYENIAKAKNTLMDTIFVPKEPPLGRGMDEAKAIARPCNGDEYDAAIGKKAACFHAEETALTALERKLDEAQDELLKACNEIGEARLQCQKARSALFDERKKL